MKETIDKIVIKQFKDGSSFWWVGNKVYHLNQENSVVLICGGKEDEKETEAIKSFILRNKKKYVPREESQLDKEPIEWITISFGKFAGKKLDEIKDIEPKYCSWLYQNVTDTKIKEQLKILLKK